MLRFIGALVCLWFVAASAGAQWSQQTALQQAIAATEAAKTRYAFRFELTDGHQTVTAHFDPRSQPHLRLMTPERSTLSDDLRRAYDSVASGMAGLSWCARPGLAHIANVRLLREDAATAAYSFQATRESVVGDQMRMVVGHLRGELTMTKQPSDILSIHHFVPEPFDPVLGVHVDRFEITQLCATAPNGRRYASEIATDERFAALGRSYRAAYVRRFSDLVEVR